METFNEMTPERQAEIEAQEDSREAHKEAMEGSEEVTWSYFANCQACKVEGGTCQDCQEGFDRDAEFRDDEGPALDDVDETNYDPYAGADVMEPAEMPENDNDEAFVDRYEGWNDQYDEVG